MVRHFSHPLRSLSYFPSCSALTLHQVFEALLLTASGMDLPSTSETETEGVLVLCEEGRGISQYSWGEAFA